ncbi:S26 family signal peptidase [Actinoallomurus acaciae]|uniref:signal peptidase I n=1 Tax=Actinoallomurus acaciae TaxID=502577 RepID=A0ABV5Y6V4_9ACTN
MGLGTEVTQGPQPLARGRGRDDVAAHVRRVPLAAVSRGSIVVMAGPCQSPSRPRRSSRHLARQRWVVKRAVAIPGDPVPREMAKATGTAPGTPVPSDHFLVMGDNSSMSNDSRMYGFVPADRLLGVVVRRMTR